MPEVPHDEDPTENLWRYATPEEQGWVGNTGSHTTVTHARENRKSEPNPEQPQRKPKRKRDVAKLIRLNQHEWKQVEENLERSGLDTFAAYARTMLVHGAVTRPRRTEKHETMRSLIGPLANNLNQIARQVNVRDEAARAEAAAARITLARIENVITKYIETEDA